MGRLQNRGPAKDLGDEGLKRVWYRHLIRGAAHTHSLDEQSGLGYRVKGFPTLNIVFGPHTLTEL